jgi:hypothetical protein
VKLKEALARAWRAGTEEDALEPLADWLRRVFGDATREDWVIAICCGLGWAGLAAGALLWLFVLLRASGCP